MQGTILCPRPLELHLIQNNICVSPFLSTLGNAWQEYMATEKKSSINEMLFVALDGTILDIFPSLSDTKVARANDHHRDLLLQLPNRDHQAQPIPIHMQR